MKKRRLQVSYALNSPVLAALVRNGKSTRTDLDHLLWQWGSELHGHYVGVDCGQPREWRGTWIDRIETY